MELIQHPLFIFSLHAKFYLLTTILQARDHFSDWPWSNPLDSSSGCDGWCEAGGGGSDGETEYSSFCTRARMPKPKKFRFSRLTMSGQYMGLCRKRIGRGAR